LAAISRGLFSLVIATGMMFALAVLYLFQFGTARTGEIESSLLLIGAGLILVPPLVLYGFGVKHVTLVSSPMIIILIPLINTTSPKS
jgi:EamA domain-containing membrane protein RarD